jgi:hypothetical protein
VVAVVLIATQPDREPGTPLLGEFSSTLPGEYDPSQPQVKQNSPGRGYQGHIATLTSARSSRPSARFRHPLSQSRTFDVEL